MKKKNSKEKSINNYILLILDKNQENMNNIRTKFNSKLFKIQSENQKISDSEMIMNDDSEREGNHKKETKFLNSLNLKNIYNKANQIYSEIDKNKNNQFRNRQTDNELEEYHENKLEETSSNCYISLNYFFLFEDYSKNFFKI